jgi:LDH2 family malate/lactate/ureidoglycolate dehydrogenase
MKTNVLELKAKLQKLAEQIVSESESAYFADEVAEAHIRKSPRSNVVKSAIGDLESSLKIKDMKIERKIDLPAYVAIDFKGHGPLTYLKQIHDLAEERANTNGLVMISFTNGKSMHTLHAWVQGLAKCGLLAIAVCNGGPRSVIPFNGTKGLFGTNPLAYGFPDKDGKIHCVDMATSEIPYFEILDANKSGADLPERSAVDSNGEFTKSAKEALDFKASESDPTSNIVPMGGGYKGYYITYLTELLTSALIGMPSSPEMSKDFVPEEHGAILLAMSPKAFGNMDTFYESVAALNGSIKSQRPKAGEEIVIPGERNNRRFAEAGEEVDIDEASFERLVKL